jgi:micrococcal nuclease
MPTRTLTRVSPLLGSRNGPEPTRAHPSGPRVARRLRFAAALLLVPALGGCGGGSGPAQAGETAARQATVERIVDGDTLIVHLGGDRVRVRLLGIDAPESVKPGAPVECYGREASHRAAALLPAGAAVRLRTDPTQDREDRYGRLLAYVSVDGQSESVNERLLREGFARLDLRASRPFLEATAFRAAQRDARAARRGLWRACGPS